MLSLLRNSSFLKFLWGFLALFFLNFSVDPKDLEPNHVAEDLSFNDQESIIEVVVEQILGYETAILEFDEEDQASFKEKKSLQLNFKGWDEGLGLASIELPTIDFLFLYLHKIRTGFRRQLERPPLADLF